MKNIYSDKLHIKTLKYICGVHKKASNYAVMGELGRYPLYIETLSNTVKYLQHIHKSNDTLLESALQENMILNDNKKNCWLSSVYFLLNQLGISCDNIFSSDLQSKVFNELRKRFINIWQSNLSECAKNEKGKLRTYGLFKRSFSREKYLSVIVKPHILKCFTNFRISSHKLEIEIGRYKNVPVADRKCKLCNSGSVEDEIHFMFECPTYEQYRQGFVNHMMDENSNFSLLSNRDRLIWLMSNEDSNVITCLADYIYKCHEKRCNVIAGFT